MSSIKEGSKAQDQYICKCSNLKEVIHELKQELEQLKASIGLDKSGGGLVQGLPNAAFEGQTSEKLKTGIITTFCRFLPLYSHSPISRVDPLIFSWITIS